MDSISQKKYYIHILNIYNFLLLVLKNESIKRTEEDILLDKVNNIVSEIKEINLINNNEIKKQNLTLDYNNEVTENSQHRINSKY